MLWKTYLKYLPLPLLVAAYPILFLYGHNASSLELGSLRFPLGASLLVALVAYGLFSLLLRKPLNASLSAVAFVFLYYLFGFFNTQLEKWGKVVVSPIILLVVVIALAVAVGYLLLRLKPALASVIQKILLVVSSFLVVYNLFGVTIPVEAKKALANRPLTQVVHASSETPQKKPDIYYIIFDEYAGFDTVRSYWHDNSVDQFETFLKQNNFFVATGSRSATLNTGSEIASRLNLQPYPETLSNQVKMQGIDNNKVMQILKANGYTTVAIDMAFQGIKADTDVQYDPEEVGGMAADEFQKTFLNTSMFSAFSGYFESQNQEAARQRDLIMYSLDKTVNPGDIQSPKFVFTHVLLPHQPFIFDQHGNLLPPQAADDWNYYLGQHQYTTKLAEQLISKLLAKANPNNPPVIIVQSDHGARNILALTDDPNHKLKDYPVGDMYDILNALYLPGFDTSQLSNSIDPINTFTVVLNHYLNADVKVNPAPVK